MLTLKDMSVIVAGCQGANGHDLWYGTEPEHISVPEALHVLDAVGQVVKGVAHLHNDGTAGVE